MTVNINKRSIVLAVAVVVLPGLSGAAIPFQETLVELKPVYTPSFAQQHPNVMLGEDSISIRAAADKPVVWHLAGRARQDHPYFPWYAVGTNITVRFEYRSSVPATFKWFGSGLLKIRGASVWSAGDKALKPAEGWTAGEWRLTIPYGQLYDCDLRLEVPKGNGLFELRGLRVKEEPVAGGKPLKVGGEEARQIAILSTDDPVRELSERRAAQVFRYAFQRAGGTALEIVEVKDLKDAPKTAVLVGLLAEKAGIFTGEDLEKTSKARSGAGAWRVKGKRLGITGNVPGGPQLGAFLAFNALGIEFLANEVVHVKGDATFALTDGGAAAVPGAAYRLLDIRNGHHVELRGYQATADIYANIAVSISHERSGHLMTHDSLGYVVSLRELGATHPEYFSKMANGERMCFAKFPNPGRTQFCWSDPGLAQLVGERFVELMKATPRQTIYYLAPGDGGNLYCHCDRCKVASNTDNMVAFANKVAAVTAKSFPDNVIMICSYVDSVSAPTVRPHPNVKVNITYYHPDYWPATMFYRHPANKPGLDALAGWRKMFPDAGPEPYLGICQEWMAACPGFDAFVEMFRDSAENGSFVFDGTYSHTQHANSGINGWMALSDAGCYVFSRVLIDPKYDDVAGRKHFFDAYYGLAGEPMLAYLARLEKARVDEDWVQNTEQVRRGFVRPEWAVEAFASLDAAEKAAGADKDARDRVLHEKQKFLYSYLLDVNRARGTIPKDGFDEWARRIGEFCAICRERGCGYMNVEDIEPILKRYALVAVPKTVKNRGWFEPCQKNLTKLIDDPVGVLGSAVPFAQEKTEKGWLIPTKGMAGAERVPKCGWCREKPIDCRQLKRPSSGTDRVLAALKLDNQPEGEVTISMEGIDNEKAGVALMALEVNGKRVYEGKVPFPKDRWARHSFDVPKGAFVKGANEIVVKNLTPDTEKDGLCGVAFAAKHDYFWGWFMFADLKVEF